MASADSSERRDLQERRKELACLTGICALFALRGRSLQKILSMTSALVASGWQYPGEAAVRIRLGTLDVSTGDMPSAAWRLRCPIASGSRALGSIEVRYPRRVAARESEAFLPSERDLLKAIAALVGTMAELATARDALARQAAELRTQRRRLERKNIALREMLWQLDQEKRQMAERVHANVARLIAPAVARLGRPGLSAEARRRFLRLAERRLEEITTDLGSGLRATAPALSPREVEICDLVRAGLATKEIASMLGVSPLTVERHRHNIRRKLGLAGASANLTTFLGSLR